MSFLKPVGRFAGRFAKGFGRSLVGLDPIGGGRAGSAGGIAGSILNPLLQYGVPLAGGALASKYLLGPSDEEKAALGATTNVLNTQQQALQAGIDTATSATPTATNLLDTAGSSFGSALDFWSPILSGDTTAMTSLLQPEINRIGTGYHQAGLQAARNLPRGGARSSTMAELPFRQAQDVSLLYSGLRPQAAGAVTDIGTRAGTLGTGLLGNILQALSQSGAYAGLTGRSLLDYGQRARQTEYQQGSDIGSTIFDILAGLQKGGSKSNNPELSPGGG